MADPDPIDTVLAEIGAELARAQAKHPPLRSLHEAHSVLVEELDELWAEIKQRRPDLAAVHAEAIQLGAMAARLVIDLLEPAGAILERGK